MHKGLVLARPGRGDRRRGRPVRAPICIVAIAQAVCQYPDLVRRQIGEERQYFFHHLAQAAQFNAFHFLSSVGCVATLTRADPAGRVNARAGGAPEPRCRLEAMT